MKFDHFYQYTKHVNRTQCSAFLEDRIVVHKLSILKIIVKSKKVAAKVTVIDRREYEKTGNICRYRFLCITFFLLSKVYSAGAFVSGEKNPSSWIMLTFRYRGINIKVFAMNISTWWYCYRVTSCTIWSFRPSGMFSICFSVTQN